MKKALKKLTAVTLTFLLLFSALCVPASAISLFDKIADVKLVGEPVVTERELDEYIEMLDEYGIESDEDYEWPIEALFDVTLSNGETIRINEYGYGISANGKRAISAYSYVDIRDYQHALENGADIIPFSYEITLFSSIEIELDSFKGEGEAELIECYVKELIPVSGIPEVYRETGMIGAIVGDAVPGVKEFTLVGAEFDIVYPDGSTERATVEGEETEGGFVREKLNGEYIDYYYDNEENAVIIGYSDCILAHPVEYIPYPIEEIVIDEVKVTDDFEAESVSYTVTKPDGTTQSFTFAFDGDSEVNVMGLKCYLGESVDEAPVVIACGKSVSEDYPQKELLEVIVMADLGVMATEVVEGPAQEDNFINRIIYRIRMFIQKIIEFLWYLY